MNEHRAGWRRAVASAIMSSMSMPNIALLTAAMALVACSEDRMTTTSWQLAAAIAANEVDAAGGDALVLTAPGLPAPANAAGKAPRRVLAFGQGSQLPTGVDAMVVADDGAAAAVDLALLRCSGITIPLRLPLGCRVMTHANAAAGGTARPFAGDFALQTLRAEHAKVLTTTPEIDVVFPIGCVRVGDDATVRATEQAVMAAARRYPQLWLRSLPAAATEASLIAQATTLAQGGTQAIIVVLPAGPALSLTGLRNLTTIQPPALLALDPTLRCNTADAVIGSDPETCGRALGETLRTLLPLGGKVVPVKATDLDEALLAQRLGGLVAALGGPAPK